MLKLVKVEWEDSAQPTTSWRYLEDAPSLEIINCQSVGWLIQQDDKVIMLAPNIGDIENGEAAQGSGFIRIPKRAITKIDQLTDSTTSGEDPSFRPGSVPKQLAS